MRREDEHCVPGRNEEHFDFPPVARDGGLPLRRAREANGKMAAREARDDKTIPGDPACDVYIPLAGLNEWTVSTKYVFLTNLTLTHLGLLPTGATQLVRVAKTSCPLSPPFDIATEVLDTGHQQPRHPSPPFPSITNFKDYLQLLNVQESNSS